MNYVDPTAWLPFNNPDTLGLKVGGMNFSVQNAGKSYSLTSPSPGVVRFELRAGDKWSGDGSATKERTEICGAATYPTGTAIHVAYGFMLEPGAANHAAWQVIGQFHQTTNDGRSPPFEIDLVGEKMAILVNYLKADGSEAWKTLWTDPSPIVRGKTYAMAIDADFDAGNGALKVARDGVTLVDYKGPMGFPNMGSVYWKVGLYRSSSDTTIAAQYSGLSITTGAVAPPVPAPPVSTGPTQAQLDAANAQIASLTAQNAALQAKLAAVRAAVA